MPVTLSGTSQELASLQFSISVPPTWKIKTVEQGAALDGSDKTLSFSSTTNTVVIFGTTQKPLPPGTVAHIMLQAPIDVTAGKYPIKIVNVACSNFKGVPLKSGAPSDGTVTIKPRPQAVDISTTSQPGE